MIIHICDSKFVLIIVTQLSMWQVKGTSLLSVDPSVNTAAARPLSRDKGIERIMGVLVTFSIDPRVTIFSLFEGESVS